MATLRGRVDDLEQRVTSIEEHIVGGIDGVVFDQDEASEGQYVDTPDVSYVNELTTITISRFDLAGTLVVIPPDSFAPAANDVQRAAVVQYALDTGHELLFTYKGKARRARVYDAAVGTRGFLIGAYDTEANDGRGGYRTFKLDRIEHARLRDPTPRKEAREHAPEDEAMQKWPVRKRGT